MATQRAAEDIVGYSALAKRSCEGEWRRTSQAYTGGEHRALPVTTGTVSTPVFYAVIDS